MINLNIDTRESEKTKKDWVEFAKNKKDLQINFEKQDVGDYGTDLMVSEVKLSIDDFIDSAISRPERLDGSQYERLNTQLEGLIEDPRPVKFFLIIGDIEDRWSEIHPNSVNGFLGKVCCQGNINDCLATKAVMNGVSLLKLTDEDDWMDFIYRTARLSEKYKKLLKGDN